MSFEKGTINFSAIVRAGGNVELIEESIMQEAYRKSPLVIGEAMIDFTSGFSLFDPPEGHQVEEDDFRKSSHVYFAVRKRQLKIDSAMMRERIDRAIHDRKSRGESLSRSAIKGIKEDIALAMENDARTNLSGSRCVMNANRGVIFTDATTKSKIEDVFEQLSSSVPMNVLGTLTSVTPGYFYTKKTGKDWLEYDPININNKECIYNIGRDFLTWMFMVSEDPSMLPNNMQLSFPGDIVLDDSREVVCGAQTISFKKGLPAHSSEVATALADGKKVKSAFVMFSVGQASYSFSIDEDFNFKKLKFEADEDEDSDDKFLSRIQSTNKFLENIEELFNVFLSTEEENEGMINQWLSEKID